MHAEVLVDVVIFVFRFYVLVCGRLCLSMTGIVSGCSSTTTTTPVISPAATTLTLTSRGRYGCTIASDAGSPPWHGAAMPSSSSRSRPRGTEVELPPTNGSPTIIAAWCVPPVYEGREVEGEWRPVVYLGRPPIEDSSSNP